MVEFTVNTNKIGSEFNPNNPSSIFGINEKKVNEKIAMLLKAEEFTISEEIETILEADNLNPNEKLFAVYKAGLIEAEMDNFKKLVDEYEENSRIIVEERR